MTERHFSVVGSGLSGGLMAIYLARQGHRVDLYERRADPRTAEVEVGRSINLAFSARGQAALAGVGLEEEVMAQVIPMPGRMLHSREGELTFSPYSAFEGEAIHSVSRVGLNLTLVEAADKEEQVTLHFNQRCEGVDFDGGKLTFRDVASGEVREVEAGIVVGADGAFSAVRSAMIRRPLFDYRQDYLETAYKELEIPAAEGGGWRIEKNALHIWPRGEYMLIALPNQDGTFTVTLFWPWEGPVGVRALEQDDQALREFFAREFPDAVPHMPNLVEDFKGNPTGALATFRSKPWHVGDKAVLIGDAAHAVVPFYGQGMNASMEDCLILDECLRAHPDDVEAAFVAFESRRWADADALQDLAVEHYLEMRDSVSSPAFQYKKKLEHALQREDPEGWQTLYSMVTFSTTPYEEARRRARRQDHLLLRAVPALAEALSPRVAHRLTAESRCEAAPTAESVPALTAALQDPEARVRLAAARGLAQLGSWASASVEALVSRLGDDDPEVAEAAAEALGRVGAENGAVTALSEALREGGDGLRGAAAWALGRIGPGAIGALPALEEALKRRDAWGYLEAAQAIGRLGAQAATAVPSLSKALEDPLPALREVAARSLGELGPAAKKALKGLERCLEDSEERVRRAADEAIGKIKATG